MTTAQDMYLTEEDFEIALANGIPRDLAYGRFYYKYWEKQKAITLPPQTVDKERKKWRELALSNGIARETFNDRLRNGWTYEKAATEPPMSAKEALKLARSRQPKILTEEQRRTADANGIPYQTLRRRIRTYGWPISRAITEPVHAHCRAHNPGRKKKVEQ